MTQFCFIGLRIESIIELGNAFEAKYAIGARAARSEISANFFCLATKKTIYFMKVEANHMKITLKIKYLSFLPHLTSKKITFFPYVKSIFFKE